MNLISLLSLIVSVLYLQIGVYVLLKNVSSRINRWFFYLSLCIAIWSLGFMFSFKSPSLIQTILWDRISLIGWLLFPAYLIRFKTLLTNFPRKEIHKYALFAAILIPGLVLMLFFMFFASAFRQIENLGDGYYYVYRPDLPVYFAMNIYFSLTFILTLYILIRWRLKMTFPREKKQFNIIFFPLLIFLGFSALSDFIVPMFSEIQIPRMAHIFSFFWLGGVAWGILHLRFFTLTPALAAQTVISEIRQVLFFCDIKANVVKSNPFTEKLLRIKANRLTGRRVTELFEEESDILGYITWAMKNGYSGPVELNIRSFQGELVPVVISIALVRDRMDDVQGIMIFGQDNREAIKLRNEIFMRQQVEKKLRSLSEILEQKVKERTGQLAGSYKELQLKMTERQRVEEQIKADIAEKDVLINEIHNRVKSNMDLIMALINTHKYKGFKPRVNKKFKELNLRVSAMLLIHENLYLSLNYSEVDFASFLKETANQLARFYKRDSVVEINFSVSEVFLDIDHAIPLGLVANELISNSLSHGFTADYLKNNPHNKHNIRIHYGMQQGKVELIIADNGKGLPRGFKPFEALTNGLPLVDVLVHDQINGIFKLSSKNGTQATVVFPVDKI